MNTLNVLITGGSGYLGRALTEHLTTVHNHAVTWVSRHADTDCQKNINLITYDELSSTKKNFDIIINLAGTGIADARWSDKRKQEILDSRFKPTQAVLDYIERIGNVDNGGFQPKLFISGSAIGWYGAQQPDDTSILTEESNVVNTDFSHELCEQWEQLAKTAVNTSPNIPVAIVRTGVVVSGDGGMVGKLKLPFSLGLGGRLGNGQQLMSWISLTDWVRAVVFIIEQNLLQETLDNPSKMLKNQQVYNLTAPKPVSNADFTQAVGNWLHRPTLLSQPEKLLKLLFGEMATLLLDGQNIYPQKLLDLGFEFEDKEIGQAVRK